MLQDIFKIQQYTKSNADYLQEQKLALGRIYIDKFKEDFMLSLEFWSIEDYKKQWNLALKHLTISKQSCFVTSVNSTNIQMWVLYKKRTIIYVQFASIDNKDANYLIISNCFSLIPSQKTKSIDNEKISEYKIHFSSKKNKLFLHEKLCIKHINDTTKLLDFIDIQFKKNHTQIENSWWNDLSLEDLQKHWDTAYSRYNETKLNTCFITAYSHEYELLEVWIVYTKPSSIIIQHRCVTNPEEFHQITKGEVITVDNAFTLIPSYSKTNFKGLIVPEWEIPLT